jgi:hypothetical protein
MAERSVIGAATLATLYGYSFELVMRQTEGMHHAQSLVTPAFGGNCANWLVGHLVSSRTRALLLLDEPPVWDDEQRRPYRSGSPPLSADDPGCLPLARLREAYTQSQEQLLRGLGRASPERLGALSGYKQLSVGDSLAYMQFHEAQHVGQLLALARLLGLSAVWFIE